MRELTTYGMLGVWFNPMTRRDLTALVETVIRAKQHCVFGNHNLHSVYLYHHDAKMRRFYQQAQVVFIDGMPLVWMARALGLPLRREHRNTPVDWVPGVLQRAAEEGWRVFFLGSTPQVARRGAALLRSSLPGLQVETEQGYFDPTPGSVEAEAVLERIRAFRPHILCVGMGMPRQEHWIVDHASRTGANVVLNVGALLELLTGELPTPPRWIGRMGLEWFYRLVSRPHRVWRRYLVEPWYLVPMFVREWVARRALRVQLWRSP